VESMKKHLKTLECVQRVGTKDLCTHCTYCDVPELQYSVAVGADDYGMTETDKEHEAEIAHAKAFL